jgi:hypothetical protein
LHRNDADGRRTGGVCWLAGAEAVDKLMPTPLWTEADRRKVRALYRRQLQRVQPRWYRESLADQFTTMHLQAAAKEAERVNVADVAGAGVVEAETPVPETGREAAL